MEVVLLENIKNLGQIGDIVEVRRGYARNFLIKFGKALNASKENISIVNSKKEELNKKNLELKKSAKKLFEIINKKRYIFSKKATENGELYGSVKPREIIGHINDINKLTLQPSCVDLSKEIIKIGSYNATINLHPEVQAKVLIEVVKEGEQKKKYPAGFPQKK